MIDEGDILTTSDVARLMRRKDRTTVQKWISTGVLNGTVRLRASKVGRDWLIHRRDLEEFLARLSGEVPPEPQDTQDEGRELRHRRKAMWQREAAMEGQRAEWRRRARASRGR